MRTTSIVEVDAAGKGCQALGVGAVEADVGPLVEQGADEALRLAIILRPVGRRERAAAVVGAVIGQHPLDADAGRGELGGRQLECQGGAGALLVGNNNVFGNYT